MKRLAGIILIASALALASCDALWDTGFDDGVFEQFIRVLKSSPTITIAAKRLEIGRASCRERVF